MYNFKDGSSLYNVEHRRNLAPHLISVFGGTLLRRRPNYGDLTSEAMASELVVAVSNLTMPAAVKYQTYAHPAAHKALYPNR